MKLNRTVKVEKRVPLFHWLFTVAENRGIPPGVAIPNGMRYTVWYTVDPFV